MENLMIASSKSARPHFDSKRRVINIESCSFDYTDVGAFILTNNDKRMIEQYISEEISIPLIIVKAHAQNLIEKHLNCIAYFIDGKHTCNRDFDNRKIESLIEHYESSLLPPFFKALKAYTSQGNIQFDCPGHQGGRYFLKHPAGRQFYRFFGENIFRSDLCNADTDLGDLLIHEGPAKAAQKHAAKVYNADKTYFVMGGSTTSNSIAVASAVSPDDLILFDRNNHKSVYTSALVKEGGRPVYMQTARDHYGLIGGINIKDFDENFLREEVRKIDPERAEWQRPFRLAVIQLGTYDGTIYNAKDVVEKIGPLCDYILFDSAWVGYEQFIPLMKHASPLLLDLDENDPGIFVVQSVHKQQAGFS